jgi:hypothetical protein
VRRTPSARCLVALITAGLLAGSGAMSPGQSMAAARIVAGGGANGLAANIEVPAELQDAASVPRLQTDTETLDEGASPPAASSPPSSGDDVETLDQGSPPPAGGVVVPVGSVAGTYVAPAPAAAAAPSYAAPVEATSSGPYIPPGFGTGHVHVAAGHPEFPVGLVSCHVGTITGRAYVGVDCPNGDSVVGFARSLDDFPFILNPDFPFEGDEGFLIDAARSDAAASDAGNNNVDVLAAMPDGREDTSTPQPQIGVSGTGAVQYSQQTHTTEPAVVTTGSSSDKAGKSDKQDSNGTSSTRMQRASQGHDGGSNRSYSLAVRQRAHGHERHQQQDSANDKSRRGDKGGHAKHSHNQKNKGNQKSKDNQKSKSSQKDKHHQSDKSKSGGKK